MTMGDFGDAKSSKFKKSKKSQSKSKHLPSSTLVNAKHKEYVFDSHKNPLDGSLNEPSFLDKSESLCRESQIAPSNDVQSKRTLLVQNQKSNS